MTLTEKHSALVSKLILLGAIAVFFIHHFYFYFGHFGFDDLTYARISNDFLQRSIDLSDHFSHRLSIIFATSISYFCLGVNDFASALPALLLSVGILILLFKLFKEQNPLYFLLAIAVYFSQSWNLFYSDKLMPDIYISCFALSAMFWYWKGAKSRPKKSAAAFTVFLLLAFISKGSIVLILPFLAYLLLSDVYIRKHNIEFWKWAFISGVIGLSIYFGLYAWVSGGPFTRFEAISNNQYINDCSFSQLPIDNLLQRLGPDFLLFLNQSFLFFPLCIAILSIILNSSKRWDGVGLIVVLLSANFMTISMDGYNPMCMDPRHFLYLSPILAVYTVQILKRDRFHNSFWVSLTMLVFLWYLLMLGLGNKIGPLRWSLIGLLCLLAIAQFTKSKKLTHYFLFVLSFLLMYPSFRHSIRNKQANFPQIRKEVQHFLRERQEHTTLVVPNALGHIIHYYNIELSTPNLNIVPYQDYKSITSEGETYLLRNWLTQSYSTGASGAIKKIQMDSSITISTQPLEEYQAIKFFLIK